MFRKNKIVQITRENPQGMDYDGLIELFKKRDSDAAMIEMVKRYPQTEQLAYNHGTIFTNFFEVVGTDFYAMRKKPTNERPFLTKIEPEELHRVIVKNEVLLNGCKAGTALTFSQVHLGRAKKLTVKNCEFSTSDLTSLLLRNNTYTDISFKRCTMTEEVSLFNFWEHFYNTPNLTLDIKKLRFDDLAGYAINQHPRTVTLNTLILHRMQRISPIKAICDYVLTSPGRPSLVELNFSEPNENFTLENVSHYLNSIPDSWKSPPIIEITSTSITICY